MQINLFSNAFYTDPVTKRNPAKALQDILNIQFLTLNRNSLCGIENQTRNIKCFPELDLLSLMLTTPPAVALQVRLQWQGQDTNSPCGLSWAKSSPTADIWESNFEFPGAKFSAEYSCSLLCIPMSFSSGKTLVNNRLLAEGLWGDNPSPSPANIFFGYYWSPCTAITLQTPLQKLFGAPVATFLNLSCLLTLLSIMSLRSSALRVRESSMPSLPCFSYVNPTAQGTGRDNMLLCIKLLGSKIELI